MGNIQNVVLFPELDAESANFFSKHIIRNLPSIIAGDIEFKTKNLSHGEFGKVLYLLNIDSKATFGEGNILD